MNTKLVFRNFMGRMPVFVRKNATKHQVKKILRFVMTKEDREICENHPEKRREVVERYRRKFPEDAALLNRKIERVFKTNERARSYPQQAQVKEDMAFCWFWRGFHPDEYMFFHFNEENCDVELRKTFVSEQERWAFRFCANDFSNPLLADKAETYLKLRQYYYRDVVILKGKDYLLFESFVKKHPVFVKKLVSSSRGRGVELIDSGQYDSMRSCYDDIMKYGKVLLEERIVQSTEMDAFNHSSVNTVRVSTFTTRNGVIPVFGFFRTGRDGSFIDNAAAGGVFASVDAEKGVVCSEGCDEYGGRYPVHPDSKASFKDFRFPDWDMAIKLVKEAATQLPSYLFISFDLAHADGKWMIVEVNPSGQFIQQGGTLSGFRSDLKEIIDKMDLFIPYRLD